MAPPTALEQVADEQATARKSRADPLLLPVFIFGIDQQYNRLHGFASIGIFGLFQAYKHLRFFLSGSPLINTLLQRGV